MAKDRRILQHGSAESLHSSLVGISEERMSVDSDELIVDAKSVVFGRGPACNRGKSARMKKKKEIEKNEMK